MDAVVCQSRRMDDKGRGSSIELNPLATAFVPRVSEMKPTPAHFPPPRHGPHSQPSKPARHQKSGHSERRGNPMRSQPRNQGGGKAGKTSEGRGKPSTEVEGKDGGPKEEGSATKETSLCRFNIFVPDTSPSLHCDKSSLRMNEKQVIWYQEDSESAGQCAMMSDDPTFNRDLKRGERFATIPPTANEKEEVAFLRRQLEEATKIWEDDDFFLEHAIERHRLAQVTHVKPLPTGLNQLEIGIYRGLFTLPWVMQVRRDFPDDAMKAKLALARATCLRGLTEESIDPEKGDVPICLVNWGLLQDPNAAKRRQKEKQEEERWQEGTREVWMHQVVAEGMYEHQSQTLYPHEFGSPRSSIAEALDKWDYGSYMYHQQTAKTAEKSTTVMDAATLAGKVANSPVRTEPSKPEPSVNVTRRAEKSSKLRPIVKTTHLNSSSISDDSWTPTSPGSEPDSPVFSNKETPTCSSVEALNNVPICAVRPSYRFKSTARNLRPIEAM